MKPLEKRKFEKMRREAESVAGKDGLLRMEPRAGFYDDAYSLVAPAMLKLMAIMANCASLDEVRAYQAAWPIKTELNEISDTELLKIRDQLRTLWGDLAGEGWKNYSKNVRMILHEWWRKHPLQDPSHSPRYWSISFETGTFFPRETNIRALMARILFDNRHRLQICVNCGKRFLKRRHDSRYCMEANCRRVDNNERQKKFAERRSAR